MMSFITATIVVVLAEMGDKTQLLAMAFAAKYPWKTVMAAIFAATVANHLLAVLVGSWVTQFVSVETMGLIAGVSFVLFGLWTIRGDTLDGEDRDRKYSAFMTVMIAFFLAEMGDKTQFATIVLAAQLGEVIPVWMGTTTGMMIADGIGIFVGAVLGSRIPERQVKWGAAIIFMLFGLYGIWDALPMAYQTVYTAGAMALVCTGASYLVNKMG